MGSPWESACTVIISDAAGGCHTIVLSEALGAWKPSQPSLPPALALFNYTFPAEGESQCFLLSKNQSSCIIFLHIAKSSFGHCICYIRRKVLGPGKTITRNNSCYLLFSCILIWIHLYWAPLPSHWTEKKERKDRIYRWDARKFCWGHMQLAKRAETELKLKGEVEKRGVNNRIPAG